MQAVGFLLSRVKPRSREASMLTFGELGETLTSLTVNIFVIQ
jgi:hypothetical protein